MKKSNKIKIFLCSILNPVSDTKAQIVFDGAVAITPCGTRIDALGPREPLIKKYSHDHTVEFIDRSNQIMMPGFVDLHFHWVQDEVRLMPKDSLLSWLENHTWPYEARFKSLPFTEKQARNFKKELLKVGTLAGLCYGSPHSHTVDVALKHFAGEFVLGNVLMTMNSPLNLLQTVKDSKTQILALARKYKNKYAVTPRFAPTTHPEVMSYGSLLAEKYGCFIQTHLSENLDEIKYVLSIFQKLAGFEDVKSYTEIYDRVRLLGPRTVLGHAIHLSNKEWALIKKRNSIIAHCPSSNAPIKDLGLGSGLFDFKKAERYKIRWALASDIGGGPYLSMFDVMQSFVKQNQSKGRKEATYTKAFYRSTLAGAKIMGIEDRVGQLRSQMPANFLFIDKPKFFRSWNEPEKVLKKICQSISKNRELKPPLVKETYFNGKALYSMY